MIKTLTLLAFSLFSFFAFAQDSDLKKPHRSLHISLGGLFTDFDALNSVLENNGVAAFEEPTMKAQIVFNRAGVAKKTLTSYFGYEFVEGYDRNVNLYDLSNNVFNSRSLIGHGVIAGLDYSMITNKYFKLYPSLGLGVNKTTLKIFEEVPPSISLGSSINSNLTTRKYSSLKNWLDFNLNAIMRIPLFSTVLNAGVNAGYRLDLSDNDWRYDDALDIGFPDLDLSSFQFAFVVGYEFDPKRYSDYMEKRKRKFKKG